MPTRWVFTATRGLRPDINDTYFGAMYRDLDGHRIEVLTHVAW